MPECIAPPAKMIVLAYVAICVVSSDKAKASLEYIALMVWAGSDASDPVSASSLWYAPQRWISAYAPMDTFTKKLDQLILYFEELKMNKDKSQQAFAADCLLPFCDVKCYLVLNGVADILERFQKLNVSLQALYTDIWKAAKKRKLFEEELSDLVMREKSQEGKGPCEIMKAVLAWWHGEEVQTSF